MTQRWSLVLLLAAWSAQAAVDYSRDIAPVFRKHCIGCHGAAQQMNGLRLDRAGDALRGGYSGQAIRPKDADGSRLYQLITTGSKNAAGKALVMPPAGPRLTEAETVLIRAWIEEGATGPAEAIAPKPSPSRHWSFQPLRRPPVPLVRNAAWVRNPIDAFVLARLEKKAVKPSPEASKTALVRRVYLDLIGLPPTPEETRQFVEDNRPDAYARLVDRLLESPHYGEKWARQWLDLARYSDSEGGIQDYARPFAWRYREWVIDALNRDMPFDQFTIEQVAGDLLPQAKVEQKLAAGFHRQTVTSREGGVDLEKLRFDQVVDRTSTIGTVWLGLTVGCAQCHDHKYDPITQKDFYSLFAFFDNTQETEIDAPLQGEIGTYRRTLAEYREKRKNLLCEYNVEPLQERWEWEMRWTAANPGKRTAWDVAYGILIRVLDRAERVLAKPADERTRKERDALTDHFVKFYGSAVGSKRYEQVGFKELDKQLAALTAKYPPLSQVMTVEEDPAPHPTHVRLRGDFRQPGIEVTPSTPGFLPGLPAGSRPDRLALARWLVSPENPLTARVTMNRMWQEFFGKGLARTSEDLGVKGEAPTHPELLDWLATEFVKRGWRMKAMHRMIAMSAVYRQASDTRPDLKITDPNNTLLARQNRMRLPAELIRDSALRASGLLWEEVGGESVKPPQPEGVVDQTYSIKWEESPGRARYRRGLYVYIQKTTAYPLMMNFDAPDRTVACSRRETSNTPLQALNLMNDPVFTEAAGALAARVLSGKASNNERLDRAFELCFARRPNARERDSALSHLERRRTMAKADSARKLQLSELDGVDPADAVAWFGISRALMNTDEFMTRE